MTQEKILIIQPLPGIGDLFWFDGHLQTLAEHASSHKISLLTKARSRAREIYEDASYIDKIFYLESIKSGKNIWTSLQTIAPLIKLLSSENFTQCWILHSSWRYTFAAYLAKIPKIYGYGKGLSKFFISNPKFSFSEMKEHPIERATLLLKRQNISLKKNPKFPVSPTLPKVIQQKLDPLFSRPWVVLCIGSTEAKKKWPATSFIGLGRWLTQEKKASVFVLGGPTEEKEAHNISHAIYNSLPPLVKSRQKSEAPSPKVLAFTDLSLSESLALLDSADLFIGNDTGMMNASVVLNKPTVGLFIASPALAYRENLYPIVPSPSKASILPPQVIKALKDYKLLKSAK